MKQRLGIAQTLIHDPELIILDEPTTGLDPQGIIDVRNLVRNLRIEHGKTIFLSSHILSEIELIATRMAILNKGKVVAQGRVDELLSAQSLIVSIETDNQQKAKQLIGESQWQRYLKATGNAHLDFEITKEQIPQLTAMLVESGLKVFSVNYRKALEDYFLKLTHDPLKN
jgi:ABC-2 type transport system ATP-binding protein